MAGKVLKSVLITLSLQLLAAFFIIVKPLTIIYEFFTIYHPKFYRRSNNPARHATKVAKIQEQVIKWNKNGRKEKMCTGRPTWQTISLRNYTKSNMTRIQMDLEEIIEVDVKNKVLQVEPGISMGTLTHKLLPQGWTIPIVPELIELTVGGCVCGAGLETSSHKYGLFADSCIEFEVILSDGTLVKCSKDDNPDLFYGIPMSHGTLGFLVGVTFPLLPAPKLVKLEYISAKSTEETTKLLLASENQFIEGIAFGPSQFVVTHGNFVHEPLKRNEKINYINRWYKPWFCDHVESFLSKPPGKHVEYIPLRDYYFRHVRSLFWEIRILLPYGSHWLFRWLVGWVLPVNIQVLKRVIPLRTISLIYERKKHVTQDFVVPLSKLGEALRFIHTKMEIYPLWLCPAMLYPYPTMTHPRGNKKEMYVDVGIYGTPRKRVRCNWAELVKMAEEFFTSIDGFQGLYADNFLTREEFERMFDLQYYEKLRKKLKCTDAFPHVYDKVSHVARNI